ncbi:uncharacterized protein [Amphiura filiformis]|uniref:uncharacterized protein n=1 Tax=Amphiura filiformis TaxID=82378 RepID=UPI003B218B60
MISPCLIRIVCLMVFGRIAVTSAADFLIVADLFAKQIQTNPINTVGTVDTLTTIPLQDVENPVAVNYDPIDQKMYWTDVGRKTISKASLDGTAQEDVVSLSTNSNADGIALDVNNRQIYWTDNGNATIEKINMDGTGREVIVQDNLDKPRGIVVYSPGRLMYWTDWGDAPKIERSLVDGTERVTLVDNRIQFPNGIAIDYAERRIYWCDSGLDTIESVDFDGGSRLVNSYPDIHPFDIYVYENYLYWTDWILMQIIRIDKSDGANVIPIEIQFGRPAGLHIHQENSTNSYDEITTISPLTSAVSSSTKTTTTLYDGITTTSRETTPPLKTTYKVSSSTQTTTTLYDGIITASRKTTPPLKTTYKVSSSTKTTTTLYDGITTTSRETTPPLKTTYKDSSSTQTTTTLYDGIITASRKTTPPLKTTYKDNEPPTLLCPRVSEQFAVTDELNVSVAWPEPTYQDNSGSVDLDSTHTSPSVFGIGVHRVIYNASDPYGNTASCAIIIIVTAACPESRATVNSTELTWFQTPASDQTVYSDERCDVEYENRGHGLADRVCMRDEARGAVWLEPNYIGCGDQDDFDLTDLAETEVILSNVENVAEALQEETQRLVNPTSDDIKNIAEVFQNIVDVESNSPEVTIAVVEVVNNIVTLITGNEEEDEETGDDTDTGQLIEILRAIEDQVERSTANGQSFNTTAPNIAIVTTTVDPTQNNPITFVVLNNEESDSEFREEDIQTYGSRDGIPQEAARTSISLPSALFNASGNGTIGVSFVVHNSDLLFPTNSTDQIVVSDVISAIVTNVNMVKNLPTPVIIEFTVSETDTVSKQCVFWDFDTLDWSLEGCEFAGYSNNRVICHCNHLTNFAVLVDISYTGTHIILELASRIGCAVSMVALIITLVIFVGFRRLRLGANRVPRQILIHLCTALFLLYFVFLVGIDQTSNRNGCIFVAFVLQYLTLASLAWMAVESFNLYLKVVRVFDAEPSNFMIKASCGAWGLPLLVTIVSFGAGFSYYDHLKYCFVDTGLALYLGMVLPIAIILIHNLVIFSLVMHRLCKTNLGGNVTQKTYSEKALNRLQNAFAMSILMGLTWVFGFFAIEDAKFAFSLIFCLCNSLQGLALFLLFCARQDDVRRQLGPYVRKACCMSAKPTPGSQTASTGVLSSTSPQKSAYSNTDFSVTFSMSPTTTEKDDAGALTTVETTTPTEDGLTNPTEDEVTTQTEDGVTTPSEDGVTTPTEGGVTIPTEDGVTTSTEDGVTTPSEDGVTTPTEGGVTEGKPTDFLIVADLNAGIIQTNLIDTLDTVKALTTIPLQDIGRPVAVDYDPLDQKMYWTDIGRPMEEISPAISRAFLNGTAHEVVVSLPKDSNANGLALDIVNRRIYWTDEGTRSIERTTMDGIGREVIIQDRLDKPRAIVVDPSERLMYWTDSGAIPKIERSQVDGTKRVTLVDTNVKYPNGIAIDFTDGRIYWCDAGLHRIDTVNFDGNDRRSIVAYDDSFSPFDIFVYADFLYYTEQFLAKIVRIDKNGSASAVPIGPYIGTPTGLYIHLSNQAICPEDSQLVNSSLLTWPPTHASDQPVYSNERCGMGTQNRGDGLADRVCMRDEVRGAVWLEPNYIGCGDVLLKPAICPEDRQLVNSSLLTWLPTHASDQPVYSNEICGMGTQNRGDGLADRVCMRDEVRGAVWLEPNYIGCGDQDDIDLTDLAKMEVTLSNVENVTKALMEMIQEMDTLTPDDLENIAKILQNIVDVKASSVEVTMSVIEVISNLVRLTQARDEEDERSESENVHFIDILRAIDDQVETSTANGQTFNTTAPNIALLTTAVNPGQQTPTGLSLVVFSNEDEDNEFREEDIKIYRSREEIPQEQDRTSISLPSTLFNASGYHDTIGVSFVVHNSDLLFPTNSTNQTVISDVISAIVVGVGNVQNLSEPVIIEFTVSETDREVQCVFWDFDILNWSTSGCESTSYINNRVTCHCNHLTNFAVLVDVTYRHTGTESNVILDTVTMIGCLVSIVALLITLFIFIGFRQLRFDSKGKRRVPPQILIQLCVALLLLYLVFYVGIDRVSNRHGCIIVAALLQYLILVSLMWMAVEAFSLYLNVVNCSRQPYPADFILKASFVAWGLPLLVTVISLVAGMSHYEHLKYCFVDMGHPLYYGVALPIGIILLVNLVLFSKVMYRLWKKRNEATNTIPLKVLLKAFAMSIFMSLTWLFGFLAVEDTKFAFSLIFCLLNSFQGLALFILFCALQEDVKTIFGTYVRKLLCTMSAQQPKSYGPSTTVPMS